MSGTDSKEVSAVIAKLKKEGKVNCPKRCYNNSPLKIYLGDL
ncbi:MAG: hypothetical protein AB7S75_23490 [Desulfococcaceae bacterium]